MQKVEEINFTFNIYSRMKLILPQSQSYAQSYNYFCNDYHFIIFYYLLRVNNLKPILNKWLYSGTFYHYSKYEMRHNISAMKCYGTILP